MTRSRLGDLIVMHGPYEVGALVPNPVMRFVESAELNALRDELIELRKVQTDQEDAGPCPAGFDIGITGPRITRCELPSGHAGDHKQGGTRWWEVDEDSCTCALHGPDPACPVHHGRRARGPKPPPLGPGCICDGSGRTCPRHGTVS